MLSNKAIDFLALPKNKQYYITNLSVNTVLQEHITKFKSYKDAIKKQSDLCRKVIAADKIPGQSFFNFVWEFYDIIRVNNILVKTLVQNTVKLPPKILKSV